MNHLNNSNFDDNDSSKEDVTDNLDNDIYIKNLRDYLRSNLSQIDFQVILDFLRDNEIKILKNFAVLQRTRKLQAFEKLCPNSS